VAPGCAAASRPGRRAGSPGRPGSPHQPAASRPTHQQLPGPSPRRRRLLAPTCWSIAATTPRAPTTSATATSPAAAVKLGSSARSSNQGRRCRIVFTRQVPFARELRLASATPILLERKAPVLPGRDARPTYPRTRSETNSDRAALAGRGVSEGPRSRRRGRP
jgi:hypothetical protein